jgi:hypothetical protein
MDGLGRLGCVARDADCGRSSTASTETFRRFLHAPTLEGQHIIKDLVLVSAGIVIGAAVRGGGLTADPERIGAP